MYMGIPPSTLIALGAALILSACGVTLLVRTWRLRESIGVPLCGRCSYRVEMLPSAVCPECGSDWQQDGTILYSRGAWRAKAGAAWLLMLALPAVLLNAVLPPGFSSPPATRVVPRTVLLTPKSGAYQSVRIDLLRDGRPLATDFEAISLAFVGLPDGRPLTTGTSVIRKDDARGDSDGYGALQAMNERTLLYELSVVGGVAVADERVQAEVRELLDALCTVADGKDLQAVAQSMQTFTARPVTVMTRGTLLTPNRLGFAQLAGWGGVWLIGALLLWAGARASASPESPLEEHSGDEWRDAQDGGTNPGDPGDATDGCWRSPPSPPETQE